MAGIVHFSWFFRYMEEAEHALWRAADIKIVPDDPELGFPRVAAKFQYHAPLRFEDEFDVEITVTAMQRCTIDYGCVVSKGGTTVATGGMTTVCVRRDPQGGFRAVDLPQDIVRGLK